MAAKVEFQDFSIQCKDVLEDAAIQFLEEAASELESQAARNSSFSKNLHGTW